ncbi:MAG: PAS domain-containing protein, partial [Pseudomonadota bacterium]
MLRTQPAAALSGAFAVPLSLATWWAAAGTAPSTAGWALLVALAAGAVLVAAAVQRELRRAADERPATVSAAESSAALGASEAESATRLRIALDKVSSNVMVADADGRIVYMNEAVTAMFRQNAAEIRKQLPSFDPERILNGTFDCFHKVPSHQRNVLAQLRGLHRGEFKLGGAVLA